MTPADRAALAARLRGGMWSGRGHYDDLLAAAAELERPRPRVYIERLAPESGFFRIVCPDVEGNYDSDPSALEREAVAAGFDVDPLPEVSDAG